MTEEQKQRAGELAEKLIEAEAKIPPAAALVPQGREALALFREVKLFLDEIAG